MWTSKLIAYYYVIMINNTVYIYHVLIMTRKEMKAVATIEYYLVYSIDWRVFIHVPCLVASSKNIF